MEKDHQHFRSVITAGLVAAFLAALVSFAVGAVEWALGAALAATVCALAGWWLAERAPRDTPGLDPAVFEALPFGIALCDSQLRPWYFNPKMIEMVGAPSSEAALGVGFRKAHLFRRKEARQALRDAISERRAQSLEAIWTTRWGCDVQMRVHFVPVLDKGGSVVGGLGVFEDIAERNRAIRALEENDARFQQVADHLSTGIFLIEADGRTVLYVNRAFEEIMGVSIEKAGYRTELFVSRIHHEDRGRVERLAGLLAADPSHDFEFRVVDPSGDLRSVRLRSFPVRDEAGGLSRVAGTLEDTTALHNLQKGLLQSQKMEAVGTLAAGVAHDFNNVLTVISGYAELLRTRDLTESSTSRAAAEIQIATERASALIRQMVAFRGHHGAHRQAIDLGRAISEMSSVLRRLMGVGIELEVAVPDEPVWVQGDPSQIEQLVLNLVFNARDALPEGGRAEIGVKLVANEEGAKSVCLNVSDNGVGMDEDVRRRTFDPFFTTKDPGSGSGLGLFAVFGIVRRMGGEVRVDSAPGKGTRFYIEFPYEQPSESVAKDTPTVQISPSALTVLLVEDEEEVRRLVRNALESVGYRVIEAGDGIEALDRVAEVGEIDVLVSDIVMPRMNGTELTEKLREEQPDVPVVLISGYPDRLGNSEAAPIPACNYLPKPFRPSELLEVVEKAAATRRH